MEMPAIDTDLETEGTSPCGQITLGAALPLNDGPLVVLTLFSA